MKNLFKKKIKPDEGKKLEGAKVKRSFTSGFYLMVLCGFAISFGLFLFILYFSSHNTFLGLSGIILIVGGIFSFRYFWNKEGGVVVERIGNSDVGNTEKGGDGANSLCLYADRVVFESVPESKGVPWECENIKKKYFVNKLDEDSGNLVPFVLPDQQYLDPTVFAQRVLGLPAHRKIFERKPKLLQRLKTAMLVVAIGIVWLLIMTTTGEG